MMRRAVILLSVAAATVVVGAALLVLNQTRAVQNPTVKLDMNITGNTYSDPGVGGNNSMTVATIDQCVTEAANPAAHNRTAHLIVQNVEDLAGVQARFNFDSTRAAVTGFNSAPFVDTGTFKNVGFVNLPIDPLLINHRDLTGASDFTVPNTGLASVSYLGDQNFPISPDTPAKSPTPDDTSYSAPSGGVVGYVVINVRAGQDGQPSLFVNLDDGNPNAPGSSVDILTGTGIQKVNLTNAQMTDGYIGNGTTCLVPPCDPDCPAAAATETPTATPTGTPSPTASPTPTETPTPGPGSPTPTETPTPGAGTPTPTETPTPGAGTPTPTETLTPTPTETPTPGAGTPTPTPSSTPTDTPTPTVTPTVGPASATPTPTASATVAPTATQTATPVRSPTPTQNPTAAPTVAATPTRTPPSAPAALPPTGGAADSGWAWSDTALVIAATLLTLSASAAFSLRRLRRR